MTNDDGLYDEMRYLRPRPDRFRSDPLALDVGTAERLLAGGLDPADAPPAYRRTAAVLAAIAAPPSPDELAGEAQAVAALVTVAHSIPHRAAHRRPAVLTKVLTLKAATAAAVAALSLAGVAAAATGTLPDPAQRAAHRMLSGVPSPDDHANAAHGADASAKGSGAAAHDPTGPDATGAAKDGLCRAWQAGQGGEHGKKDDAVAFKALADAAGGADKIAAFCADTTANGQSKATPPSTVPEQGQGQAGDHGAGDGQGQPPADTTGQGQGKGSPSSTIPDPHN